ncbi:MAG: hypothetical protein HXY34_09100 [Candidatus Thorarchaeota archaeon]|nr:hypothetical protein [Candidatus Thorarchaeota archaeon]
MMYDVSKVRYVSLIRLEGGESILSIPYAEMSVDPDLIAGFVTAVIIFAKAPIRTISKAAYDILIEVGETVLVLLVVDPVPDETPYREKLKRILSQVETEHGEKLKNFEGDIRRFREFALNVIVEFPYGNIQPNLIPVRKAGKPIPFRVGEIDRKLEKLEAFINGKRSVAEILDLIELRDEEVKALLSLMKHYGAVDFRKRLDEKDVLVTDDTSSSSVARLRDQYGRPVDDLIKFFDGSRNVKEVVHSLPYDHDALLFLINKLVECGGLRVVF